MTGGRHLAAAAALALGGIGALGGIAAAAPATGGTADSASASPADTTDALSDYLERLSAPTDDDLLLDELSVTDAQVDSMIRAYEASGGDAGRRGTGPPPGWRPEIGIAGVRFNRVEGVNALGEARLGVPSRHGLDLFARGGYGWSLKETTWRGGVRAGLGGGAALEVSHAREVWAYGAGGVPGNSVLALTAGRDEQDYLRGEGWTASLALPRLGPTGATVTFTAEEQRSMPNGTEFTLFDEGHRFRLNPPIDEGRNHRLELALGAGDAAEGTWAVELRGGTAGGALGGDFDYDTAAGTATLRRRTWFGDEAKLRLDGGLVTGDAPVQSLYFLGGARRLRGHDVNEIPAREAVHAALDYKLGTNPLGFLPYLRRLRIQPVPFVDAAAVFSSQRPDGTRLERDTPDWLVDAGIGLQYNVLGIPGGSGQVRLDFAWRLDRGEDRAMTRLGFTIER